MKYLSDPAPKSISSTEADLEAAFDHAWREIGERERAQPGSGNRTSLFVECSGELVEAGSVETVGIRRSALGMEIVTFVCTRCDQRHESLALR